MPVILEHPERPGGGAVVAVAVEHDRGVLVDARPSQERFELGDAGYVPFYRVFQVRVEPPADGSGDMALMIPLLEVGVHLHDHDGRVVLRLLRHPLCADQDFGVSI